MCPLIRVVSGHRCESDDVARRDDADSNNASLHAPSLFLTNKDRNNKQKKRTPYLSDGQPSAAQVHGLIPHKKQLWPPLKARLTHCMQIASAIDIVFILPIILAFSSAKLYPSWQPFKVIVFTWTVSDVVPSLCRCSRSAWAAAIALCRSCCILSLLITSQKCISVFLRFIVSNLNRSNNNDITS